MGCNLSSTAVTRMHRGKTLMPVDYEQLDVRRHRQVRIGSGLAADLAGLDHVQIGMSEAADLACDYPLALLKDRDTGQLRLVALLGLLPGCNAYVQEGRWAATLLPRAVARAPFAWGDDGTGQFGLAIDMAHPRTNDPDGQPLFEDDGSDTPLLAGVRAAIDAARQDAAQTRALIDVLVSRRLLQPFALEVDLVGSPGQLIDGLYTIGQAALEALADDGIVAMHRSGQLAVAHTVRQSLGQLHRLQQLHNARAAHDPRLMPVSRLRVGLE